MIEDAVFTFKSQFMLGQRVRMNGEIEGVVAQVRFVYVSQPFYTVEWFDGRLSRSGEYAAWQLEHVP